VLISCQQSEIDQITAFITKGGSEIEEVVVGMTNPTVDHDVYHQTKL